MTNTDEALVVALDDGFDATLEAERTHQGAQASPTITAMVCMHSKRSARPPFMAGEHHSTKEGERIWRNM